MQNMKRYAEHEMLCRTSTLVQNKQPCFTEHIRREFWTQSICWRKPWNYLVTYKTFYL